MASGAAKRYTEAVFDIAREKGSFDQWQQDLDALAGLMSDDGAALVLNSPKISRAQKMSLIEETLRRAQPESLNLATLLLDRRRQGDHGGADRPTDRGRHPTAPELPGREAGGDPIRGRSLDHRRRCRPDRRPAHRWQRFQSIAPLA